MLSKRLAFLGTPVLIVILFLSTGVFPAFETIVQQQAAQGFTLPCTIATYGNAWDGAITFALSGSSDYLVVMKTDGTLLYLRESTTGGYQIAKNIAQNTLMFTGDLQPGGAANAQDYATHIWNLDSNLTQDFPNVIGNHDIEYNPIDNTFLTLQDYVRQVGNNLILFGKIVQLDTSGNVLWSWDTYDHIPLSEDSSYDSNGNPTGFNETTTYNGQTVEDFTHCNSLYWDYNNGIIYLNSRGTNTFYKIDQATGDIVWACGEFGNFTLLDNNGQAVSSLWYHSHDVTEVAPDVFTMFDNDFNNITNPDDCHSRMIELTLNETDMTAHVDWSWEAPTQYWNSYAGGTTKLPNGDYLGDFGDPTHQFPQNQPWNFDNTGAVFVEVNPAGQIVRTWTFPVGWYVYRVEPVTNLAPSSTPTAYAVVRGSNNMIYYRTYNASGSWSSWNSLPTGSTPDGPAAAYADKLYFVVRGSDGNSLWFSSLNLTDSSFSGWTLLSGSTPSAPTLTSNGTTLALVVRGENNNICYRFYTIATQTWTDWTDVPSGTTIDSPSATLVNNTLQLVVRGVNSDQIWYSSVSLTDGTFSGWTLLDGATPSAPTLTANSTTLTLVVRGENNIIYYRFYTIATQTWTSWTTIPTGSTMDSPAATITGNSLQVAVRGVNNDEIWQGNLDLPTSTWSGWTMLDGATPSKPTLTS